jgi:hypothetical protein
VLINTTVFDKASLLRHTGLRPGIHFNYAFETTLESPRGFSGNIIKDLKWIARSDVSARGPQ